MVELRSQEDDPVPQWFSRWKEANDRKLSQWEARLAELCSLRQQPNQRSDDQSTYDWRFGGDDRRFGGGQFHEGADDDETYGISAEFRDYWMRRHDDETWTWTEHYSVMEDETDLLEEESMQQFQVPISDSEIVRSIEPGKVDLGLEKEEYVVLNENLEQEWDQKNDKKEFDVVGEVERDQKVTSDTKICYAHQLFDQKPVRVTHKEKHMRHLKAWKFKFKPTPKRSRLMDDKFSFVDATVLLNKDPKKTIWDCVKKELKETKAACEKNRVDRFKLAEEKESKLQVLDLHQTFMCHQIGRVWEPGGLPNKMDLWDWFETELKACGESQQVERFLYSLMQVVKRNLEFKTFESNKTFSDSDIASFIGLEICGFETKKHVLLLMKLANRVWECGELLATHVYHKWLEKKKLRNVEDGVKQDKNRFSGDVGAKVFMASEELHLLQDVFEMVKEMLLETSLVSPQVIRNTKLEFAKQWMFKFRKKKIDQQLGCDLMVTYLENQTTWTSRFDEEDQGILQLKTENSLSRRSTNAHGMITRGKDGIVKPNLRSSLLAVQRIWEKVTHDVDITDAYYVLQEEFEQVENHIPCSVVKLERPQDHDALLLPFHGDERFQIKHKWRSKLLLSILELELYLDSLVLITSYAHQFDIISLIILMSVELSVSSLQNQMDASSLQNLEVKVSSKEGDLMQNQHACDSHVRSQGLSSRITEQHVARENWKTGRITP